MRPGVAWYGEVRSGRPSRGEEWHGLGGELSLGWPCHDLAWSGEAQCGEPWQGEVKYVQIWCVVEQGASERGAFRNGSSRNGLGRMELGQRGAVWHGLAGLACHAPVKRGVMM